MRVRSDRKSNEVPPTADEDFDLAAYITDNVDVLGGSGAENTGNIGSNSNGHPLQQQQQQQKHQMDILECAAAEVDDGVGELLPLMADVEADFNAAQFEPGFIAELENNIVVNVVTEGNSKSRFFPMKKPNTRAASCSSSGSSSDSSTDTSSDSATNSSSDSSTDSEDDEDIHLNAVTAPSSAQQDAIPAPKIARFLPMKKPSEKAASSSSDTDDDDDDDSHVVAVTAPSSAQQVAIPTIARFLPMKKPSEKAASSSSDTDDDDDDNHVVAVTAPSSAQQVAIPTIARFLPMKKPSEKAASSSSDTDDDDDDHKSAGKSTASSSRIYSDSDDDDAKHTSAGKSAASSSTASSSSSSNSSDSSDSDEDVAACSSAAHQSSSARPTIDFRPQLTANPTPTITTTQDVHKLSDSNSDIEFSPSLQLSSTTISPASSSLKRVAMNQQSKANTTISITASATTVPPANKRHKAVVAAGSCSQRPSAPSSRGPRRRKISSKAVVSTDSSDSDDEAAPSMPKVQSSSTITSVNAVAHGEGHGMTATAANNDKPSKTSLSRIAAANRRTQLMRKSSLLARSMHNPVFSQNRHDPMTADVAQQIQAAAIVGVKPPRHSLLRMRSMAPAETAAPIVPAASASQTARDQHSMKRLNVQQYLQRRRENGDSLICRPPTPPIQRPSQIPAAVAPPPIPLLFPIPTRECATTASPAAAPAAERVSHQPPSSKPVLRDPSLQQSAVVVMPQSEILPSPRGQHTSHPGQQQQLHVTLRWAEAQDNNNNQAELIEKNSPLDADSAVATSAHFVCTSTATSSSSSTWTELEDGEIQSDEELQVASAQRYGRSSTDSLSPSQEEEERRSGHSWSSSSASQSSQASRAQSSHSSRSHRSPSSRRHWNSGSASGNGSGSQAFGSGYRGNLHSRMQHQPQSNHGQHLRQPSNRGNAGNTANYYNQQHRNHHQHRHRGHRQQHQQHHHNPYQRQWSQAATLDSVHAHQV